MNIDEFEKIMQKKYDEVEVPESVGKNIIELAKKRQIEEIQRKNMHRNNLFKIAACFMIMFGISGLVYFNVNKINNIDKASDSLNTDSDVDKIFISNKVESEEYNVIKPQIIAVIKLDIILKSTNYSIKQNRYYKEPITFIKVKNVKSLFGKIDDEIVIYKFGGIVDANNLKNINSQFLNKNNECIDIYNLTGCVEVVTNSSLMQAKPEIGKKYLVCLQYDSDIYDSYCCYGKYGFVEYNEETGKVKNVETGEWEDIDKEVLDIEKLKESEK